MPVVTTSKGSGQLWRIILPTVIGLGLGLYASWYIYDTVVQWPTLGMPLLFGGVAYVRELGIRRRRRPGAPGSEPDRDGR